MKTFRITQEIAGQVTSYNIELPDHVTEESLAAISVEADKYANLRSKGRVSGKTLKVEDITPAATISEEVH